MSSMLPAPSLELHCHLDGSVRVGTIARLASDQGIDLGPDIAARASVGPDCRDLVEYIAAIDIALAVLQTPEALATAARELVETWSAENVIHGEVRFAPLLHRRRGLKLPEIISAVSHGLQEGSAATGVSTSLIAGCMRNSDPIDSWSIVEFAATSPLVAGIDMTGPEAGISAAPHAEAFRAARDAGVPITAHAGEAEGAWSVWQAIDELGAGRIGHGVRAIEDPLLIERMARDGIVAEMCPVSNVQTKAVASLEEHPVNAFRAAGVPVAISSDSRTVSRTSLPDQWDVLRDHFEWSKSDWRDAQRVAAQAAFVPGLERVELRDRVGS